jgi:tetratricopeptide (TPR) repeat protein
LIAYLLLNTLATVCGAFAVFWIVTQAPARLAAQLKTPVSGLMLAPLGIIAVIQVAQFVLVYMRWQPMYWVLIALAVVNLVTGLALMFISMNIATVIGFAFSFIPLVFLFLIEEDFMLVYERIWCGPDKGIRSHSEFYARGREYARNKMWTLAALHFRRAVAGAPNLVAYHLALTAAYVGLKRYDRAESVLREARRLEPGNARAQELADLIATHTARSIA